MSVHNPWSIKGVDETARAAAKQAARNAGMTLGQWLNHVIQSSGGSGEPVLLSTPIDQIPEPKTGTAAVEAVRGAIKSLLERLQDSQTKGALTLDTLETSLRELVGELESSRSSLAEDEQDQHTYLAGLTKDLFDLTTRVSLMESSRSGNTEASAIQILEEAIGRITAFIEAADKRQTDAIKSIGSTLDTLAGEVGRQNKSREATDDKLSKVTDIADHTNEKIIEIQSRVTTVERRQSDNVRLIEDTIDTRFDDLDENFGRLRDRLRGLERRNAEETDTPVAAMEVAIERISRRLDMVETSAGPVIEEKIRTQNDAIKQTEQAMKEGFTAITGAVEDLAGRIGALETGSPVAPRTAVQELPTTSPTDKSDPGEPTPNAKREKSAQVKLQRLQTDLVLDDGEDERAFDENAGLFRYLFALILIIFLGTSLMLLATGQVEMPGGDGRPGPGSSLFEFFRTLTSEGPAATSNEPLVLVENTPRKE